MYIVDGLGKLMNGLVCFYIMSRPNGTHQRHLPTEAFKRFAQATNMALQASQAIVPTDDPDGNLT